MTGHWADLILKALLLAKAKRRSLWRALLVVPEQAGIGLLLRDSRVAGCHALALCLASCPDAQFEAPEEAANTLLLALSAPLRGAMEEEAESWGKRYRHLAAICTGYLLAAARIRAAPGSGTDE